MICAFFEATGTRRYDSAVPSLTMQKDKHFIIVSTDIRLDLPKSNGEYF